MAIPKKVLRKTSQGMLPGYMLGRLGGHGYGPVELLSLNDLVGPGFGLASAAAAAAGSAVHGFGFSISGLPGAGQVIGIATFPYQMTFTSADPGDVVNSTVAATGTPAFQMQVQVSGVWTQVGTITWTAAGYVGAVAWTGGSYVLAANTQMRLVAPASQDATLSDISGKVVGVSG